MKKPVFKMFLVNMPFAALNIPSLALTQLKSVLDGKYQDRVSVEIMYLNHDFARYMGGVAAYGHALSKDGLMTGVGDWFFRQSAFPELADNSEEYFSRYYWSQDPQIKTARRFIKEKRVELDCFLDELITKYSLDKAGLVGFTSLFAQTVACFAMARKLKQRNPDIITVMGGSACEAEMGQEFSKHVKQIDFVFSGPGLVSFPQFIQHCLDGEMGKCDRINGVFSKTNRSLWRSPKVSGKSLSDPPGSVGPMGDDLDINIGIELDYAPFLDAFEKNFSNNEIDPILLFETSRGCWWGERSPCSFCGLNGLSRRYRAMSSEKAVLQFESLFRYSPQCSYFISVDNIMPKTYVKEVFPVLNTPPGVRIRYEVRSDLSEADTRVLCNAGVRVVQPGIESLSTSTLKLMRKGATAFGNIRFLKDCSVNPITLEWNLLICSPREDEEVYKKYLHDIPLLMHLPPPTGAYPIEFVRYSHYFDHAEEYGLDLRPQDFYGMTFPLGDEAISKIAYHFVDNNADTERIDKWLDAINEKIALWRTRWFNQDRKVESRLCLVKDEESTLVYDSRSGKVIEHQISDVTRKVLEYLTRPSSITELAVGLGSDIRDFDPGKEIAFLQDRGLVFQERERFLSLVVCPEENVLGKSLTKICDCIEIGRSLSVIGVIGVRSQHSTK